MVRINTDEDYAWRLNLYDDAGDALDENTRSGAIDASCEFARDMVNRNLPKALEHEDMTPELAEILSTRTVRLRYEVETDLEIGDE